MISYREKQLLMVMKMLQDDTQELASFLSEAVHDTQMGEKISLDTLGDTSQADSFEKLVSFAENKGYDAYVRAKDILTQEELADVERRKADIEKQFKSLVKLQKGDYAFLFSAVALLLAKQIILKLDLSDREETSTEADKEYSDKYKNPDGIDGTQKAKRYYAPAQQIQNTKTVPYDIVKNTKYFNHGDRETGLGLDGDNHRFKSVGHDPLLGLAFGTANIMTNTATFYVDKKVMASFHVKYEDMTRYTKPYIHSIASTNLMFKKVYDRAKKEPDALRTAFVKEIDHINSDKASVAGIPLPFLAYLFGDETARTLALEGFDLNTFITNAKVVGTQASVSVVINLITSLLHRLYLLWDEVKAEKEEKGWVDAAKKYLTAELNQFDKVRTKKVILYANAIASTVNVVACVGGGILAAHGGEAELTKEFLSHLDIGGLMVTIAMAFKDGKYILKVKDDFIKAAIDSDFQKRLAGIEEMENPDWMLE